jgi:SAM-dependent methyltransferase
MITLPGGEVNNGSIRRVEKASILDFMERHRRYLRGRVLDFGSGLSPYKHLVEGEYVPREKGAPPLIVGSFDAIMCNQVVQELHDVVGHLGLFHEALWPGGHLVMTYPLTWPERETVDLWRFTKCGMELLLKQAGFEILNHERRAEIEMNDCKLTLGYGVLCRPAK